MDIDSTLVQWKLLCCYRRLVLQLNQPLRTQSQAYLSLHRIRSSLISVYTMTMADTPETVCAQYVEQLNATFRSGKTLSYEWRIGQLKALKSLVKDNESAIIEAIVTDLGM